MNAREEVTSEVGGEEPGEEILVEDLDVLLFQPTPGGEGGRGEEKETGGEDRGGRGRGQGGKQGEGTGRGNRGGGGGAGETVGGEMGSVLA